MRRLAARHALIPGKINMAARTSNNGSHTSAIASAAGRDLAIIVEPSDRIFANLAEELRNRGLRVMHARTAAQGLALCVDSKPDVLAANVDAPDQSGWLLVAKLSMTDQLPPNSVVYGRSLYAVAADALGVRALPCVSAGCWRYADAIADFR